MWKQTTIIFFILTLTTSAAQSQTIGQLLEQLALDTQKLSELKTILHDLYSDYAIVNKGYTDIKNIAEGNFKLHQLFLDALLVVSPAVRHYPRAAEIIDAEYSILADYKTATARAKSGGQFTPAELIYLGNTYSRLLEQSEDCLNRLTMVMTDDQLRMSDDARMQSIDRIYEDIMGQLRFIRQFDKAVSLQAIQRARQAGDASTLKTLYGIPN